MKDVIEIIRNVLGFLGLALLAWAAVTIMLLAITGAGIMVTKLIMLLLGA